MTTRTFDRRPQFDERSRRFGIAEVSPDKTPRSYSWNGSVVLDQGSEGACVGFGWSHELIARPMVVPGITNATAREVYLAAQRVDEWDGEDYEGTSVLAGAKVVQSLGHMRAYRWGFSLTDLIMGIGYTGPAVMGLNWYTGMFEPDSSGYIRATGSIEGGHCICAYSVNIRKGRIGFVNSWGTDWGQGGHCWMTFEDVDRLLHEQGEQCFPVERQKVAA